MANEVQIDVKINGLGQASTEVKGLTKALGDLKGPSKQAQDSVKSIEGSLQDLTTKGFGGLAKVAVGAFGTLAALFAGKEIINAAMEDEQSINDLNITLSQLGIYSKQTSEEMQAFTDQIQKTTRYSDDQATSVINLLGSMSRLDKEGLQKATTAALDLASTFKIDVDTAAKAVGKSLEGNTGALKRYNINVKEGATESERLANTLDALSKFAGRSQKDINTFGGALSYLKNGFDSVLEAIGKTIVQDPLISAFIKNVGEGFFKLADNIKAFGFSFTKSLITMIDGLISFGVTFQEISDVVETIIATVLIVGFNLLLHSIVTFAVSGAASLYQFVVAMQVMAAEGTLGFVAISQASRIGTAAIATFTAVLTGGLIVALALVSQYLVESKDAVGGWSNLFKASASNIGIAFLNLRIKILEFKESLSATVDESAKKMFDFTNKMRALVGLPPINIKIDGASTDKYRAKIEQLNMQVDNLGNNIAKLADNAEKSKGIDPLEAARASLKEFEKKFKETQDSIKNGPKLGADALIDTKKIESDFDNLYKALAGADQGDLGRINASYEQRKKVIYDYLNSIKEGSKDQEANEEKGYEALLNLNADYNKQKTEQEKKSRDERIKLRQEEVALAKSNPLGALAGLNKDITKEINFVISPKIQGLVEGFGEVFAKGAEGARNMLVSATAGAIDTLLPGVGSALKPFIDVFSQGAEQTKKMVKEFVGALPKFISALISAIPAFFQALSEQLPLVVNELAALMPQVAIALGLQMPFVAFSFVTELVKNVPYLVSTIAVGIYNAIVDLFNKFTGGASDVVSDIGDFFGLAQGGKMVKGGIQGKDSVPIATMPGELVVDKSLTRQMQNFFDNNPNQGGGGGGGNDVTNALLAQILNLLSQPQEVSTSVQLNNKTLADILINLSRTNTRTA